MPTRILLLIGLLAMSTFAQPAIEPGVSHELAKWRAAHYSDIRYKLNLTLEKMSPVLKGTIEIRVRVKMPSRGGPSANIVQIDGVDVPGAMPPQPLITEIPIILDWRKIRGHEEKSTISNVTINGQSAIQRRMEIIIAPQWPPRNQKTRGASACGPSANLLRAR